MLYSYRGGKHTSGGVLLVVVVGHACDVVAFWFRAELETLMFKYAKYSGCQVLMKSRKMDGYGQLELQEVHAVGSLAGRAAR